MKKSTKSVLPMNASKTKWFFVAVFFMSTVKSIAQPCDCEYRNSPCYDSEFNIFISYSGYDRDLVTVVTENLRTLNIPYWDYQESCPGDGTCRVRNITRIIQESEIVIVVNSRHYLESPNCRVELETIRRNSTCFSTVENLDSLMTILRSREITDCRYLQMFID